MLNWSGMAHLLLSCEEPCCSDLKPREPLLKRASVVSRPQSARPLQLTGDELLPAVDVVGRSGEGRVGHDVYGERGDIGRCDHAPDGKRGPKLIAAVVELITEERCRQRCVDEAGSDEVDSDRREFERETGGEGGQRSGDSRDESESLGHAAATSAPHEEESSS